MPKSNTSWPSVTRQRFDRWQVSAVSQRYLTPDAAAQGYTVLRVPPHSHEAFLILAGMLLARSRYEVRMPRLIREPDMQRLIPQAQTAWEAWVVWTKHLTAYFERLAAGKDGTVPPVPHVLQDLVDLLKENEHD